MNWTRSSDVRDLRWIFVSGKADRGCGRRRFGNGRGEFSFAVRDKGLFDSPAEGISRVENHDRSREGQSKGGICNAGGARNNSRARGFGNGHNSCKSGDAGKKRNYPRWSFRGDWARSEYDGI